MYYAGAQLNNNQQFQDITGIKRVQQPSPPIIQEQQSRQEDLSAEKDDEGVTTNAPSSISRSSINLSDEDDDEDDSSEIPVTGPRKEYKYFEEEGPVETIRFDKPFYWYLQDEVLGPVYVGIVNSFKTYKEQVASIEDGFDDMFKYQFWSCGTKHLALIDMFQSPLPPNDDAQQGGEEDD